MTEDVQKIRIRKSELNNQMFILVNNIYGLHLIQNTFVSPLTVRKAKIAGDWDIKKTKEMFIYEFSNPNFFDIYLQERGLKPQIITVKNKKFMRFKKPDSRKSPYQKIPGNITFEKDGYIYTKMVNHPGVEGRQFIHKMMTDQALWDNFSNQISKKIDEMITEKMNETQQEIDKLTETID